MNRSVFSRRGFTLGAFASISLTTACGNGVGSSGGDKIDARADATLEQMFSAYPNTKDLADKSNGMLIMPLITEASFGWGGAYGQGALRIEGATVDYYSMTELSGGLQIGAQQYAHVLFFMTEDALAKFRSSSGWAVGGNVQYVISDQGDGAAASTTTALSPVLAAVFNRGGLFVGAALEGNKYNRIIP